MKMKIWAFGYSTPYSVVDIIKIDVLGIEGKYKSCMEPEMFHQHHNLTGLFPWRHIQKIEVEQ